MLNTLSDPYFMDLALKEAQVAYEEGEVPVGAVVVIGDKIIAKAYNQVEKLKDVTAHAEMLAITSAASAVGGKYLNQCKMFVTLEPCPMCAAALRWAQIGALVYGAEDPKMGFTTISNELLHPKTKVSFGLRNERCQHLLKDFFQNLRDI